MLISLVFFVISLKLWDRASCLRKCPGFHKRNKDQDEDSKIHHLYQTTIQIIAVVLHVY